jgi:protein-disulfide isomerase
MKKLLLNVATVACMAGSAFAGHALAAEHTISALPDSSAFGSNVAEVVQTQSIQHVHGSGSGDLKQIKCAVAAAVTSCYVAR